MDILDVGELRLVDAHPFLHEVVELQIVGDGDLPLLLRVLLRARCRGGDRRLGAYVSLSGRFYGLRLLDAVEDGDAEELEEKTLQVLEADLLGRARCWLRAWLRRRDLRACSEPDVVVRGRQLVDALGEVADRQQQRSHRSQLELLDLVGRSLQLFDGLREKNQAWVVRGNNPLGQVMASTGRGHGPPDLRAVEPSSFEARELFDAVEGALAHSDPDERLDQVAVEAWQRLSVDVLGRFEARGRAEEHVMEQVIEAYGLLLGHVVGGAVLGRPDRA